MRARSMVVGLALTAVASACGARVTPSQVAASRGVGATATPSTPGATGRAASSDASPDAASSPSGAGPSATTIAEGAPSNSAAGGNGGATDVGVTGDSVALANISTLSGPVPGLFQGAVIGAQAAVAYQNSLGGVHGRRMRLSVNDDQFDSGANRSATQDATSKAFALLGSFSVYDDAGAESITKSGMPDLSYSLSDARRAVPSNFSVEPAQAGGWQVGYLQWIKTRNPTEITAVGSLFPDLPAGRASFLAGKKAAESLGWRFAYERAIQPTETDFTADVVRMRQSGVRMVWMANLDVKAQARVANAFGQQGFHPVFIGGASAYDPSLVPLAKENAEGMIIPQLYAAFAGEDAQLSPEIALFNRWVDKIKPGYKPDLFAMFSWAEGRLLFKAMEMAGPRLTRAAVNDAIRKIDVFDANGMVAPASPARKQPPTCFIILTVRNGKFSRLDPAQGYICNPGGYFRN